MSDPNPLDLKTLQDAVAGGAAAFRCVTELQPAGGPGDKVFPPTYEGGAYAHERRVIGGQRLECVVLDSVASQANRIELALLRALKRGRIALPLIEVDFSKDFPDVGRVSQFEAPHRIADAILRDSTTPEGTAFRDCEVGRSFTNSSLANATALFVHSPTALVLGMWDSTGPRGGGGAKFQRCLVSEIVGIDVEVGVRTESRIDPLEIQRESGVLFKSVDGGWTLDQAKAQKVKGSPVKLGKKKEGKPSDAVHGNIVPSVKDGTGGVTLVRAQQITTLSLPGLRRLNFPIGGAEAEESVNDAGRTALAALGLCGAVLSQSEGLDLRSRCLLVATHAPVWELLGVPGSAPVGYSLDATQAEQLLREAAEVAQKKGLAWSKEPLTLTPKPDLVTLVRKSRDLASAGLGEEG
jgi:CRISPR-associated protein Csb1